MDEDEGESEEIEVVKEKRYRDENNENDLDEYGMMIYGECLWVKWKGVVWGKIMYWLCVVFYLFWDYVVIFEGVRVVVFSFKFIEDYRLVIFFDDCRFFVWVKVLEVYLFDKFYGEVMK